MQTYLQNFPLLFCSLACSSKKMRHYNFYDYGYEHFPFFSFNHRNGGTKENNKARYYVLLFHLHHVIFVVGNANL